MYNKVFAGGNDSITRTKLPGILPIDKWPVNDEEATALSELAENFFKSGDQENTLKYLLIAHKLSPNNAKINLSLGNILLLCGHDKNAEETLADVLPEVPAAEIRILLNAYKENEQVKSILGKNGSMLKILDILRREGRLTARLEALLLNVQIDSDYSKYNARSLDIVKLKPEEIDADIYNTALYNAGCYLVMHNDKESGIQSVLRSINRIQKESDLEKAAEWALEDSDLAAVRSELNPPVNNAVKAFSLVMGVWKLEGYTKDAEIRKEMNKILTEANTLCPDLDELKYAWACYYALEDQSQKAMDYLKQVSNNPAYYARIKDDSDLSNLHGKKAFTGLVKSFNEDVAKPVTNAFSLLFG